MSDLVNVAIVRAIVRRDLRMYFSNPSGYVFITLFIFLSAAAAFWQDQFFLNNLANLDQLSRLFPYLLMFFVPALTMAVWAEERKQGTDELLLTLPARDIEVVLGKYFAALGVYAASLVLSLSHVFVLLFLGSPDLGLMVGNYLGYGLLGAALIAVGMLGSLLTANATIAFILGAVFCGALVSVEAMAALFSDGLARLVAPLGVLGHFGDFARGVVSLSGLFYFLAVIGVFLFLNVLLIGRRHWPSVADVLPMWGHQTVRAVAIGIAVISVGAVVARASLRLDVTAERLHSLSGETRRLLSELPDDRPVFIQAYVSPTVPEQFVQTRETVLGLLREIDAAGGARVQVRIEETEPFTEAARDARETFGITPQRIPDLAGGRAGFNDVFLGLAFTCGAEEQVIPFFDRGLPAEYEIARSIRVVARTERRRIGVVNTGIRLFGGLDFQTMQSTPAWSVVEELRKQYEVVEITPSEPIADDLEGLVVVLPSSLTQEEMDQVEAYAAAGRPTLMLVDPMPTIDLSLAPAEEPGANRNPFMQQGQPPPPPKGNVQALMARLGVAWDPTQVVWDAYNPHPDLAQLPPEVVFVGGGNESEQAFNVEHGATAALQEFVTLYPGHVRQAVGSEYDFQPLASSGRVSGTFQYFQMVQRSFFGTQLNQNLPHQPDSSEYVLAAHVRSAPVAGADDAEDSSTDEDDDDVDASDGSGNEAAESEEATTDEAQAAGAGGSDGVNLIVIADVDFISEQFFQIRRMGAGNLNFDNITFFLNAIDVLVGDESFVALRNRRVRHRTLARVEAQTRSFIEQRAIEEAQAEGEAEQALAEAQGRLDERVAEVQTREDLDARAKEIMARNLQEVENRRFEVLRANIEADKEAKIQASMETMESQVRQIQSSIRTLAVLLPPIPVFVLGVMIFVQRQRREREGAAAAHRMRS
ncbi:MAG: Gldg family protein [Vicinamibacterales bacterium]|jgi:ABC-2 type transport system permease protein|nr:ABC transporter [Acidobacteriota bacterium]MDP6373780.1 Gldg family protein [Vicinamibacterales bacterium]MDP6608220.1 Gldg family protein [Vicinamibacterales bacterium]HAK55182.1 ABC transporter [Acidobacteriota bacterium]|tara:strand:+ start:13394 stop:16180 length:2787 start_codon:yes stop_codon:yes gene_type:complete